MRCRSQFCPSALARLVGVRCAVSLSFALPPVFRYGRLPPDQPLVRGRRGEGDEGRGGGVGVPVRPEQSTAGHPGQDLQPWVHGLRHLCGDGWHRRGGQEGHRHRHR
eukprot:1311726-Alexandrium_andersonii.AAC.1